MPSKNKPPRAFECDNAFGNSLETAKKNPASAGFLRSA